MSQRARNLARRAGLALVALLLGAPPYAQQGVQAYEGAAAIGNLDRVTVVYPAAEGERGRVNRDSAGLRAAYLRERYGVDTTIAGDDAVTEAQLAGHLLVLGWDNRLIRSERPAALFARNADGLRFLSYRGLRVTDDLLWMYVSPFHPDRIMVFWSRIDPDLDRLLAFPFVGSDWAVYRDFFIVAQGNFEGSTWPPVQNPLAEHESTYRTLAAEKVAGRLVVRYQPDVADDATIGAIVSVREAAIDRAAGLLGVTVPDGFRVQLFLYADRDDKYERTGVYDSVHSLPSRDELHMQLDHARSSASQEEIHLLADELWGLCHTAVLYQGLAVALQADPRELGAYAALLVEQDAVPGLDLLFDDERLRKLARDGIGFPAAGLFVQWIRESGGDAAVRAAYTLLRDDGPAGIARILGLADAGLAQASFATWIAGRAGASTSELEYRRALAQASERARVGDLVGQGEALRRALALRPGNAELDYQVAVVELEAGDPAAARARLERLIAAGSMPDPAYVTTFGHYQLGRIEEGEGNVERAREHYGRVLSLPDVHGSHRLAQEALDGLLDAKAPEAGGTN